jgi:TonB family protein
LDIGADNGGIVLNISETGVAVHAVSVLPAEPLVDLRLQLPRSSKRLETKGKVAWTSGTKKEAGVEFVDLPEDARLEIREWLASENVEPVYLERGPADDSPIRKLVRRDKWTNLVSELASIPAGIDRVKNDRAISTHPATVAESIPREETVVPAPLHLNAITRNTDSAASSEGRDYALPKPLLADERESNRESTSIPPSDVIDRSFSSSPDEVGYLQNRRSDLDSSLPSDKLLNASHPISIISSRGNKTENAKGFHSRREANSSAADGDDFLKKARALFDSRQHDEPLPLANDSPSTLESVKSSPSVFPVSATSAELAPAPVSDVIATSKPSNEPFTSAVLQPATSISLGLDAPRGAEAKSAPAGRPPTRNSELRRVLGLLTLCLVLAAACLALGIVVGRSGASHSPDAAESPSNVSAQPLQIDTSQRQSSANSNQSLSAPPISHGQSHNQVFARDQRSSLEATSHGESSDSRPRQSAFDSSAGGTDYTSEDATHAQATGSNSAAASPAANAGSGVPTAPAPSATTSAPEFHVTPAPEPKAAPPPQPPPSDRLVPAHLIYRVEPIYPRTASGAEGTVKVHATVGRDGTVRNLKVVSGPPPLTAAAIDAAQYWRYIPALRNGDPVETEADISIEFRRPR